MSLFNRLKQYKFMHWAYNLLHYKSLSHNRDAYKKYNLQKPLVASVSSRDFPDKSSHAWLDVGDSRELAASQPGFDLFSPDIKNQLLAWSQQGFLVWKSFLDPSLADQVNADIDALVRRGKLSPTHDHKLMFANRQSRIISNITKDHRLLSLLSFILQKEVVPFQTINFIHGSNQRAHSDSIHMTTYPLGYLVAVWIALEDTNMENGPLFYYPGSHRLPYLLNEDFYKEAHSLSLVKKEYTDYEDVLEKQVEQSEFKKEIFLARKGDLLVWHANLIHGGSPVMDPSQTRKSLVIHYYAKDVIKYHEFSERPSLLQPE